jgi:NAD(P)-dependent dehydrogenase (short-subunit alcohol dehydrogenase family)
MNTIKLFDLSGRIAIVTGGTGLFGRPISLALAECGAHVIIASRNIGKCNEVAKELINSGYSAEGAKLDLADEDSINGFVQLVGGKHKRIDILINNSVSRDHYKRLEETSKSDWEAAQEINSTGLMLICKAVVQQMVGQNKGSIVNIGSIQGSVGPNFEVYGSTGMSSPLNYTYDKWGMVGLTKWMANQYGKYKIRVNCLSPGGYGPGVEATYGKETEFTKNYKNLTPLKRFAYDDDIKGPVAFLASDAGAFVTGHNLLVDGGWTSW